MAEAVKYPHTGMTVSQRREFLKTETFIKVKWLVEHVYQKPDGSPLLTYEQSTTVNRDETKQIILDYEVANGLVYPDGTETQQMQPTPVVPQGEIMTAYTSPSVPGVPTLPAPATPAQAVQAAASVPGPQEQPAPTARPVGRPRKSAAGAAVAPPPGPPVVAQTPIPVAPSAPGTQSFMAPPQVPGINIPVAPTLAVPQMPSAPQAPQAPVAPVHNSGSVDLTPVLNRLDQVGEFTNYQSKYNDKLEDNLNNLAKNLSAELEKQANLNKVLLAAVHHLYVTALGPATNGKANTMPEFLEYMKPFVASIPSPK